jgi:TM2 domain-containing membrane protein YozV
LNKNGGLAFLLSFIPGLGHLYLGRKIRAFIYGCGFFGPLFLIFISVILADRVEKGIVFPLLFISLIFAVINMIDMIVYLISPKTSVPSGLSDHHSDNLQHQVPSQQNERFFTTLLSFIPGLGHFQLGLMQRGSTFLVGFFGLMIMIIFVTAITNVE